MENGLIIKALSGFYYVKTDNGIFSCRARGKMRLGNAPLVGDNVGITKLNDSEGALEIIYPRKNSFVRPAVANIDVMVFVASETNPVTDPFLIDRVSVIAESCGCRFAVCINKEDLSDSNRLRSIYEKTCFDTLVCSAKTGAGIDRLSSLMKGKTCVLTGNSGAGKSSILNAIMPQLNLETGEVSEKLGRGKHTTRHTEMYSLDNNTIIADSPGFASFDIEMMRAMEPQEVVNFFPDLNEYKNGCRYDDCKHLNEPGCSIREAVNSGQICRSRYDSFVRLYSMIDETPAWERKRKIII